MKNVCRKFRRQIEDLVCGAAHLDRANKLREHINQCPACSQYHQELLGDEQLLIGFCEETAPSISRVEKEVIEQINLSKAKAASISRVEKGVIEQINRGSTSKAIKPMRKRLNLIERI